MEKKVIIITGSTRGIGFHLAKKLLEKGNHVIINGRSEENLRKALKKLQNKAVGIAGDISNAETVEKLLQAAQNTYGKIDIWINNAAVAQDYKLFHELDDIQISGLIDINLKALMLTTKQVIRYMLKQGHGQIYNFNGFGSNGMTKPKLTLYGTSKCAVNYFSRALDKELKGHNIKIGTIQPGMTDTDFLKDGMQGATQEEKDYMLKVNSIMAEPVEKVASYIAKQIAMGKQTINYTSKIMLIKKIIQLKLNKL